VEGSLHAKNHLDSSSHFDTIPACDRRMDRRTCNDSTYQASIALCSKKKLSLPKQHSQGLILAEAYMHKSSAMIVILSAKTFSRARKVLLHVENYEPSHVELYYVKRQAIQYKF